MKPHGCSPIALFAASTAFALFLLRCEFCSIKLDHEQWDPVHRQAPHTLGRPPPKPNVLKPIELEGDVARENHEVGPGDFPAVFLFDRPQEPARLVEIRIVRPRVEGREALLAGAGTAAAVADAGR